MKPGHWLALGFFLTGLAVQLQGLHSWSEVTSIPFVSGSVAQLGAVITAMMSKQLGRDPTSNDRSYDPK